MAGFFHVGLRVFVDFFWMTKAMLFTINYHAAKLLCCRSPIARLIPDLKLAGSLWQSQQKFVPAISANNIDKAS